MKIGIIIQARMVIKNKPNLRLTIDTEDDWRRADALLQQTGEKWLMTEELIELCLRSA